MCQTAATNSARHSRDSRFVIVLSCLYELDRVASCTIIQRDSSCYVIPMTKLPIANASDVGASHTLRFDMQCYVSVPQIGAVRKRIPVSLLQAVWIPRYAPCKPSICTCTKPVLSLRLNTITIHDSRFALHHVHFVLVSVMAPYTQP